MSKLAETIQILISIASRCLSLSVYWSGNSVDAFTDVIYILKVPCQCQETLGGQDKNKIGIFQFLVSKLEVSPSNGVIYYLPKIHPDSI